jgi:anti-sigma-K factor RskA
MMNIQHISQDDLALYALRSLSSEESAAAREHLSVCDVCWTELARLEGDLAMVALSVDQHPLPPGARERFAERLNNEIRVDASTVQGAGPVPIRRSPRFSSWMGWIAAAAILIIAATLGFEVRSLKSSLDERNIRIASLEATESRAQQVVEVLTAPTAQRVLLTAAKTPPAPSGHVVYLSSSGALILQANNMTPVPPGKTYELWVIPADGSAAVPAGLFRPDPAGNGSVVLPAIPRGLKAKAFGVTLENAAGSKTPTAPILLAGAVPESGE